MDRWDACAGSVDAEALNGHRCYAGLDLANTTDIAALVLCFPDDGNALVPFFWVPEEGARQRERRDRVPYVTWAREGYVELTPGDSIDYRYIRKRICELGETYGIEEVAYDPYNATHLATELGEEDGFAMVQFRQGLVSMNEPCKAFEGAILRGDLAHGGNPVLRWMASNMTVRTDASSNIRPDKERSNEKIDGVVAAIMAHARSRVPHTPVRSVYEDRGVLTL